MPCLVFLPCYHTGFQAYLHTCPQEMQSDKVNCGWAVSSTAALTDSDTEKDHDPVESCNRG